MKRLLTVMAVLAFVAGTSPTADASLTLHVRQAHLASANSWAVYDPAGTIVPQLNFLDDELGGVPLRATPCGFAAWQAFGVNSSSNVLAIERWGASLTVLGGVGAADRCFSYPGVGNVNFDRVRDVRGRVGYVAIWDVR